MTGDFLGIRAPLRRCSVLCTLGMINRRNQPTDCPPSLTRAASFADAEGILDAPHTEES